MDWTDYRLECLRLAVSLGGATHDDVISCAEKMCAFVIGPAPARVSPVTTDPRTAAS